MLRRTLANLTGRRGGEEAVPLAYTSYETTKGTAQHVPSLIVMHGLFGSKSNWNSLCKAMHKSLDPPRQVFSVDARNHGDSSHTTSHTYGGLAEDIRKFYGTMRLDKASLLGHSMGGRAVMKFALRYPELVNRLVVVDISPIGASRTLKSMPVLFNVLSDVNLPADGTMSAAKAHVDAQLATNITDASLRQFLLTNLVQTEEGRYKWRINLKALSENFEKIASFDAEGATYKGPTLFVGGGDSDYLPKEHHDRIRTLFPEARFEYIDGTGHWLHAEKPNEFLQIVLPFLNS